MSLATGDELGKSDVFLDGQRHVYKNAVFLNHQPELAIVRSFNVAPA